VRYAYGKGGGLVGYVRVFSGANGALLYQLNGEASGEEFGRFLDAGDLTG
jgi:hypothetical protein